MNPRSLLLSALHDGPQTHLGLYEIFHDHSFWPELKRLIESGEVIDTSEPHGHKYSLKGKSCALSVKPPQSLPL